MSDQRPRSAAQATGAPMTGAQMTGAQTAGAQPTPAQPAADFLAGASDEAWLDAVRWDEDGLVPAIAQDAETGRNLMVAWMNREALRETAATGRGVYWSRSRGRLWRKGEESGHFQTVKEMRLDCDQDVILLKIHQHGGIACHTGRESCFYSRLEGGQWVAVDPVLEDPERIYRR